MRSLKLKNLPMAFELINKKYNFVDERKEKINLPNPENGNEFINNNDDIEMKDENGEKNNNDDENENGNEIEEESDEDIDEDLNGGKASFDFLKMDIFKTDKEGGVKGHKIKRAIKKFRKRKVKLKGKKNF